MFFDIYTLYVIDSAERWERMSDKTYPFHVQLHLTDKCNLKCKHCYEGNREIINEWEYDELLDVISKLEVAFDKWNAEGEISLVGGEPVLWTHLAKLLYRIDNSHSIKRMAILTNGVYLPEDVKKAILDTKPTVQISIDGITEEKHDFIRGKGNYKKAISTIKFLVDHGIQVFVHYVISKYTVPITEEFIQEMDKLGVSQITFSRDVPIGASDFSFVLNKEEIRKVLVDLNNYRNKFSTSNIVINSSRPLWACFGEYGRCPVGIQTITIMPDGTVFPCRRLPIKVGNIRSENLFSIWYNSDILWDLRNREKIKKCGKCQYLDMCGGARCIAYAVTGDYMGEDPQCWL